MADIEVSVRELVERDRDCTEKALAQMDLRRKINLLIGEWKAAGGGDVLPNVRDRMRLRSAKAAGSPLRVVARR
ncbi:hypothetical protein FXB41_00420 [Bradyrhizobium canariense]|uniref:hypothetical protein n=1 Tax=Bradyrhizobium TaxID=374 RepID=UPI00025D24D7|nr:MULTISPECIES: hypothetical protein [Bradyrhizobium]EIG58130.1 hypothetical protein Bra1253DRAFT_02823 [Bradyrhizobium sp. WSM1253]MBW5433302.1 hypothetical protein [Bradyrhizobium canariense]